MFYCLLLIFPAQPPIPADEEITSSATTILDELQKGIRNYKDLQSHHSRFKGDDYKDLQSHHSRFKGDDYKDFLSHHSRFKGYDCKDLQSHHSRFKGYDYKDLPSRHSRLESNTAALPFKKFNKTLHVLWQKEDDYIEKALRILHDKMNNKLIINFKELYERYLLTKPTEDTPPQKVKVKDLCSIHRQATRNLVTRQNSSYSQSNQEHIPHQ